VDIELTNIHSKAGNGEGRRYFVIPKRGLRAALGLRKVGRQIKQKN
jgi:hypothetical protein